MIWLARIGEALLLLVATLALIHLLGERLKREREAQERDALRRDVYLRFGLHQTWPTRERRASWRVN